MIWHIITHMFTINLLRGIKMITIEETLDENNFHLLISAADASRKDAREEIHILKSADFSGFCGLVRAKKTSTGFEYTESEDLIFPEFLVFHGDLSVSKLQTSIPNNLTVYGTLTLEFRITKLPKNLKVGRLDISCCEKITTLPECFELLDTTSLNLDEDAVTDGWLSWRIGVPVRKRNYFCKKYPAFAAELSS